MRGNRGRFSVMTEKQRMTYIVPGDEYGENSKSSGRQRDLPCDAAGITGKGYTKTTRNAYGEPSPVHTSGMVREMMDEEQFMEWNAQAVEEKCMDMEDRPRKHLTDSRTWDLTERCGGC